MSDAVSDAVSGGQSPLGSARRGPLHVYAWPEQLDVDRGATGFISVAVTNTSNVIDAYDVQVFGLDPDWVEATPSRLSLFPGETGNIDLAIKLPHDHPSSRRTLAINVVSADDPSAFALAQVELTIRPETLTTVSPDPTVVTSGRSATFGLVVANAGNAVATATAYAIDPEDLAEITISPKTVMVAPGREQVVQITVRGGRAWFGQARPRQFTLGVEAERTVETSATWVQRPRIGRWLVSLLGLLTAAAVFAAVLSRTFDRVVDEATVDQDVLEAALADDATGAAVVPANPGGVKGSLVSTSGGSGIGGAQADLVAASDPTIVVGSAATNGQGLFEFTGLGEGEYLLRVSGSGIGEVWYPGVEESADASVVTVELEMVKELDPIRLSGIPVVVSGTIESADPTAATITLVRPPDAGATAGDGSAGAADAADAADAGDADAGASTGSAVGAVVGTADVAPDGSFTIEDVPSPGEYQLVIEQPGSAVETRTVVLQAGESPEPIAATSRSADGTITGLVLGPDGPLGGVSVTAVDGTTSLSTVTLTSGDVGTFVLRELPRPGQYTVVLERDGFGSESRTISLDEQRSTDRFDVRLQPSEMAVSGRVLVDGQPSRGLTVRVSGGEVDRTKPVVSQGANAGSYTFRDLPAPGTYTLTFDGDDVLPQVRVVELDPRTGLTAVTGIDASLSTETTVVSGTVEGPDGLPISQATVTLTDGARSFSFSTADEPIGQYEFAGIPPGAYTLSATRPGTVAAVVIVNISANDAPPIINLQLGEQASVSGRIVDAAGQPVTTPFTVRLFDPNGFPNAGVLAVVESDGAGTYRFDGRDAPEQFVVAVYAGPTTADPLDSVVVRTEPGETVTAPDLRSQP